MDLNEKGFILPMTLIICTMIIFFFVTQVDLLMTDRIYYHELEEKRELDNLMNLAMLDVETLMNTDTLDIKYTISFEQGHAEVSVYRQDVEKEPLNYIYQVYISCIIHNGQKFSLVYMYDPSLDRIYNLVEAVVE